MNKMHTLTKTQALAQIRCEGQYIENKLPLTFLQQYFSKDKKLVKLEHLVPIDQSLLGHPILNTDIIYHQLIKANKWQQYLPDKVDNASNYIYNLFNTCSGMGLEQILEDAIFLKKETYRHIKNLEDQILIETLATDSSLTPAQQYRNQRINNNAKRINSKNNGFKAKQAKAIQNGTLQLKDLLAGSGSKLKQILLSSPEMEQRSENEMRLLKWRKPADGDMSELKELIKEVFKPKFINVVSCHLQKAVLTPLVSGQGRIDAGKFKVRLSIEYKQSLSVTPSNDPRLVFYLSLCTDGDFIKKVLQTVKIRASRMNVHYSLIVHDPSFLRGNLPLQTPQRMTESVFEIKNVETVMDTEKIEHVQAAIATNGTIMEIPLEGKDDHICQGLNMSLQRTQEQFRMLADVENELPCPECFLKPKGKHFCYFECGHVLCSSCSLYNFPSFQCPTCQQPRLLLHQGEPMSPEYVGRLNTMARIGKTAELSENEVVEILSRYETVFQKLLKEIRTAQDQEQDLTQQYVARLERKIVEQDNDYQLLYTQASDEVDKYKIQVEDYLNQGGQMNRPSIDSPVIAVAQHCSIKNEQEQLQRLSDMSIQEDCIVKSISTGSSKYGCGNLGVSQLPSYGNSSIMDECDTSIYGEEMNY